MTISSKIMFALPAMLTAALASPLAAEPVNGERITVLAPLDGQAIATERVRHADLNLALASDQKQLLRRVSLASFRVCTANALGVSVSDEQFAGCSRAAIADAAPRVAQAIERARQLAANGSSTLTAVGITVAGRI